MDKLNVAVLGATGAVGQRFVQLLADHPWFRVAEVTGSERSAGQPYGEVVRWVLDDAPPVGVAGLMVKVTGIPLESPLVFSALPKDVAVTEEARLAAVGHVICTNASVHRMDDDVPLLLPEVNAEHLALLDVQRAKRGWSTGAIIANSNCTTMPVVMSLKPLVPFGIEKVLMVSEQAISGAGYPGVPSLDIIDNIIPYVSGDEGKMETETLKMLGTYADGGITWLDAATSATCTRVPVIDGHLVNISVSLREQPSVEAIIAAWQAHRGADPIPRLPSAPMQPVQYLPQIDRPQVRRDRNAGSGMTTSVGRIRPCPVLGYKYAALTHNTIRGAAGSSILNAELMAVKGYIAGFQVPL